MIIQKLPLDIDIETKKVLKKSISASRALSKLNGIAKTIPNQNIIINSLVLQEAKDSSAIENIITTHDELYKSEIDKSNISQSTKEVNFYAQALKKGYSLVKENNLILTKHIVQIQSILENNDAGIRKQSGTTLKNEKTGEIIFTPPQNGTQIRELLSNLEQYINTEDNIEPLIKMAIIHHQFESIHPFYDGNGRTGRILNILYLVLNNLLDLPILYLSRYITKNKTTYYKLLQEVRDTNNWEEWILYILEGVEQISDETTNLIENINNLMIDTKKQIQDKLPKIYSKDLLEVLFLHPYTKIDFLVNNNIVTTRQSASTYLKELEKIGILSSTKIGRSKFFINIKLYNMLKKAN